MSVVSEQKYRPVVFSGQSLGLADVARPADFVDAPFARGWFQLPHAFFHPGKVSTARLRLRGSSLKRGKASGERESNPVPMIHSFL